MRETSCFPQPYSLSSRARGSPRAPAASLRSRVKTKSRVSESERVICFSFVAQVHPRVPAGLAPGVPDALVRDTCWKTPGETHLSPARHRNSRHAPPLCMVGVVESGPSNAHRPYFGWA